MSYFFLINMRILFLSEAATLHCNFHITTTLIITSKSFSLMFVHSNNIVSRILESAATFPYHWCMHVWLFYILVVLLLTKQTVYLECWYD